jgi:hypothetical protein
MPAEWEQMLKMSGITKNDCQEHPETVVRIMKKNAEFINSDSKPLAQSKSGVIKPAPLPQAKTIQDQLKWGMVMVFF